MKNKYLISTLLATCILAGCDPQTENGSAIKINGLTLSETNLVLSTNETKAVSVNEISDQSLLTWTSSDESVATVYNGYITAVGDDGNTTIVVSYGNYHASCTVSVNNESMKSRIEILSENVVISKTQEFSLTANVIYNNKIKEDESKLIEWKSNAPQIVQVISKENNTCKILGKAVGQTTIIAYVYSKGMYVSKSIDVEVKENEDGDYLLITNGEYTRDGYVVTLPATKIGNLENKFTPKVFLNGSQDVSNSIVWDVDNDFITCNNGVLTVNKSGSTTITGTYQNGANTIQVNLVVNAYKPHFNGDEMPLLDIEILDLIDNHDSKLDLSYYIEEFGISDEIIDVKLFEKNILVEYNNKVAKLNLSLLPIDGKIMGENIIEISTNKAVYEIPAYVLSKRIYTKEDIQTYFVPFINGNNTTATNGLYLLENDIDYEGEAVTRNTNYNPNAAGFAWGGASGFSGIIDGQGHSIKNFKTGLYGIFGKINAATIKNLDFKNIKYVAGSDNSILGNIAFGTILENVSFEVIEADVHDSVLNDCHGLIVSNYSAYIVLKGVTIQTYCFELCSLFGSGKNNSQELQGSNTLVIKGTKPQRFCGLTEDLPNSATIVPSMYQTDSEEHLIKNDNSLINIQNGLFNGKTIEGIYNNESCYKKFVDSTGARTTELASFLNRTNVITAAIQVNHSSGGEFKMFAKTSDGSGFYFTMVLYDKVLSSPSDFKEIFDSCKTNGAAGFSFGYYILTSDIDFQNAECGDATNPPWITSGYGGTINGLGHKIKNIKTSNGGLLNAFRGTLKNVIFDNVTLTNRDGACLIGQFVQNGACSIKNVKINIANSCLNTKSSIICSNYCVQALFEDVEIHAEGLDLPNIFGSFGGIASNNSAFIRINNFHIYCNSIACFAYSGSSLGGDLVTDAPSGIKIN